MINKSIKYIKPNVGKVFSFCLVRQLVIAHTSYFLIEDEEQNRFILPSKYYLNYGFKIGNEISCKLDRINCKGELFFEPLHPDYKAGEYYSFNFISRKEIIHILGFKEQVHVVSDKHGCEHFVRYSNNLPLSPKDQVFLWSIRKGKMLLLPMYNGKVIFNLGGVYPFKIESEYDTDRLGAGFLLIDAYGNRHVISRNHYKNYNINIGDTIECKIVGNSSKGYFYLEPLHPIYKIGETYEFEIFNYLKDREQVFCFVVDCFGGLIKVKIENQNIALIQGQVLKCKIIDLHKGVPELQSITN